MHIALAESPHQRAPEVFRCIEMAGRLKRILAKSLSRRIFVAMNIDAEAMKAGADLASDLLKSLSNRHRLLILCRLSDGEHSVGQLADFLGIRDSTVSQHLALLRRDKIIGSRRDAQTIWYRIESEPARAIIKTLYNSFCNQSACA